MIQSFIFISILFPNLLFSTLLEDLQAAIVEDNQEKVSVLLNAYPEEKFLNDETKKSNLFFSAIENGNLSIIESLVAHPAFKNYAGFQAISSSTAAEDCGLQKLKKIHRLKRKLKKTKSLSREEGEVHKKIQVFKAPCPMPTIAYFSPLHCATFAHEPSVVTFLLKHGHKSQLLQQNEEGDNSLHIACMHHDNQTLFAMLGAHEMNIVSTDERNEHDRYLSLALAQYNNAGRQPLHELLLCKKNEPTELLIHLLLKNANPCAPVLGNPKMPLTIAMEKKYFDCVGVLSLTPNILLSNNSLIYVLSKIERNQNPWSSVMENVDGHFELFNYIARHVMSLKITR